MPKSNIFSSGEESRPLFNDERSLYPEYLPERLPHREPQISELVYAFKPVLSGLRPRNVFVYGSTGTGKTATVRYVLRELEEHSQRAKSIYLNCFEFGSRQSVLAAITNFLGIAVPRRGIGADETYTKLLEGMKKCKFVPFIVLDEVDQLLSGNDGSKLLYDLLRITEYGKAYFGLIAISNDFSLSANLDPRVKSSLAEQSIVFERYSPKQLKDILSQRSSLAFAEGSLEKDVIPLAAAHAAKLGGDARIGIECLWKAGKAAEKEGAEKVSVEHLRSAFSEIETSPGRKLLKHLDENQKILVGILVEKDRLNSGELFREFNSRSKKKITDRRFREIASELAESGLLKAIPQVKGKRGKTRVFSLAVSKEFAKGELENKP
ncbi:MAG: AAA family ATPase [archaeon]